MTEFFHIGNRRLIPLSAVGEIVPYSRDYVARLAREGKISAAQINRQWFIDPESLKSFFEHAQLELKARTEYMRSLRREELDLHEWWEAFSGSQAQRQSTRTRKVLKKSIIVIILGMFVGLVLLRLAPYTEPAVMADLITGGQMAAVSQSSVPPSTERPWFETGAVISVDEQMSLDGGIILWPQSTTSPATATDLFSDPVIIEMSGSSTGIIYLNDTATSVPFVMIPDHTRIRSVIDTP